MDNEQNRVNDLKEHLYITKVELSVVTSDLSVAVKDLDATRLAVTDAKAVLADIRSQAETEKNNHLSSIGFHRDELANLKKDKEQARTDLKKTQAEHQALKQKIAIAHESALSRHQEAADSYEQIIANTETAKIELEKIEALIEQRRTSYDSISEEERVGILRRDALIQEITLLEKTSLETQKKLDAVLNQIEEEQKKIGLPVESLKERELAVAKRERNFEVMYARLNKAFEKLNPGMKLKI